MKKFLPIALLAFLSCNNENKKLIPEQEKDFCSSIHRDDSVSLSQQFESIEDSAAKKTGVYVLEDGGGAMVARAWLSEYAEKSIDVQYFIFSTDNVGLIAADYLVRAADRGVKVRVLVDDIVIEADEESLLALDAHPNIEIKIYNPGVNFGKSLGGKLKNFATDFRNSNQRMHNKTFIVDGKVVITGGRNIADEYFDYDHEYNFRDRDVLLLGSVSKDVQTSFNEFWNHELGRPIVELADTAKYKIDVKDPFGKLHQYACNPDNFWPQVREKIQNVPKTFDEIKNSGELLWIDSVKFVSDAPGKNDGKKGIEGGGISTSALIKLVEKAEKSIIIESPYLVTTDLGKKLFEKTVKRGVDVSIITNSMASTDNADAFSGYQRDREKLLETGVKIYEFRPDAQMRYKVMTGNLQKKIDFKPIFGLHAKTMVIDNKITVIGTFNLDPRSANLNTECVTIIHSQKIAEGVLKGIVEELKPENSWFITKDFNPDDKVDLSKRLQIKSRRIVPKGIL